MEFYNTNLNKLLINLIIYVRGHHTIFLLYIDRERETHNKYISYGTCGTKHLYINILLPMNI